MDYTVHGILQAKILECVAFPSPGNLPNPEIEPRSPALQMDSLLVKPQRKPKNTGVGSLSLLQRIFPTQELNWDLLHCRQILYQLRYQESPSAIITSSYYCSPTFLYPLPFLTCSFYCFIKAGPSNSLEDEPKSTKTVVAEKQLF